MVDLPLVAEWSHHVAPSDFVSTCLVEHSAAAFPAVKPMDQLNLLACFHSAEAVCDEGVGFESHQVL